MELKKYIFASVISLLFFSSLSLAAPKVASDAPAIYAVVTGVQLPAWIERDGVRKPLTIGMSLRDEDTILTGKDARVLLKLAEGSSVKLGEEASMKLANLSQEGKKGLFTATLDVIRGAFRFTTDKLAKAQQRDVKIKIATVTAGVRGTDVWGKAADDKEIVCLIEGKVHVSKGIDTPVLMDEPLQFYISPKDGTEAKLAKVTLEQLGVWGRETEINPDAGAMRQGGKWKVVLVSAKTQDEALSVYDKVRKAGYPVEIAPVKGEDGHIYAVRISNFISKKAAQVMADQLEKELNIAKPKVAQ